MYSWNMKKLYTSDFPRKSFFIIKSGWLIHFLHHSLYWCLCVSISSTFYCYSIILNVSLAFFPCKQCTLPTTLEKGKVNKYNYCIFSISLMYWKCPAENAVACVASVSVWFQSRKRPRNSTKKKAWIKDTQLGSHCSDTLYLSLSLPMLFFQVWGQQWKEQGKGGRAQHVNIIQSTQVLMSQIAALRLSRWTLW